MLYYNNVYVYNLFSLSYIVYINQYYLDWKGEHTNTCGFLLLYEVSSYSSIKSRQNIGRYVIHNFSSLWLISANFILM